MSTADEERIKEDMAEQREAANKEAFDALSEKLKETENPYAKIAAELTDEEPEVAAAAVETEWATVGWTKDGVTFTGSGAPTPGTSRRITKPIVGHSMSTTSGGSMFGPGGIYTSPPFAPTTTTTTTSPWGTPLPAVPPDPAKSKKNRFVRLPPRFTEKVLVAFVDEDDPDAATNVVWAAHLRPAAIELNSETGEMELVIRFSMEDHYDNNPED